MQQDKTKKINWKALLVLLALPLAVGGLSGFLIRDHVEIYQTLSLPPFSPPAIVFPIAWTILYLLMGISSYLVYQAGGPLRSTALLLYGIQLVVNFFWPIFFFNMQTYLMALVWLILLVLLVFSLSVLIQKIRPAAAYLLLPYLLWLLFAVYLNYGVYMQNTGAF